MHESLLRANRAQGDFYPTPPEATHALFDRIGPLTGVVWEPACGDGSMAKVIAERCPKASLRVSDLYDRGYGETGVDFLQEERMQTAHVVTNPPYSLAEPFVRHALGTVPSAGTVAMLLKLNFLEGIRRKKLFEESPPSWVYVFSRRLKFPMPSGQGGGVLAYAWFVWLPDARETRVGWI